MRRVALALIAAAITASPLAAQGKGIDGGTFEFGGFARYNSYPNGVFRVTPTKSDRWGFGGRIGYFVARNLAIELDGSSNPADLLANQTGIPATFNDAHSRPLLYTPFHLNLVYNAPLSNRFLWMFGVGGTYTKFTKAVDESHAGIDGMTGIRWRALRALSFRLEGTIDYLPTGIRDKSNTYLGAQLGLSITPGGHCDRSLDAMNIQPTSAALHPGDTETFTSTALYCGNPDQVVFHLTGPGTLDSLTGLYTATGPGTAQVTAISRRGRLSAVAVVTVTEVPPAAAPPAAAPPAAAPPAAAPPAAAPPAAAPPAAAPPAAAPPAAAPPAAAPPAAAPPAAAPPTGAQAFRFNLAMVHFRFDHADLTQGGQDSVKAIAATLQQHPEVNVDVIGHTDWISTEAYNMKLSRARAETVRRLLVASGVDNNRITVKWRGEDEPIADNHTAQGRAMNRRAEVRQNN